MSTWFEETLHTGWANRGYCQRFQVTREIFREKSEFQEVVIFETPSFGRVLALDGIIQTTERDEFIYHEMMAHVPIVAHGDVSKVLIIGGGDGGVLREVLRHPGIAPTMVEIDRSVIDMCTEHMPSLSDGAFDDPRAELVIADGLKYVAETDARFDVIIVDSTDPIGPGEVLFTEQFYADCKRCLTEGGILVTQNGVAFFQGHEVVDSRKRLTPHFAQVDFYCLAVPTYVGGFMTLGWATDNADLKHTSLDVVSERVSGLDLKTRYYNPEIHVASFAAPTYVRDLM